MTTSVKNILIDRIKHILICISLGILLLLFVVILFFIVYQMMGFISKYTPYIGIALFAMVLLYLIMDADCQIVIFVSLVVIIVGVAGSYQIGYKDGLDFGDSNPLKCIHDNNTDAPDANITVDTNITRSHTGISIFEKFCQSKGYIYGKIEHDYVICYDDPRFNNITIFGD